MSYWLVLGWLLVEYGRPQDWIPPLGALHVGMIVTIGGLLALWANRPIAVPRLGKYMLVFLFVLVAGVPFAFNVGRAYMEVKNFSLLIGGAILPLVVFVDSYEKLRRLLRFWVALHVPLAFYSITHSGFGIGSFLGDENDFCLALNVAMPYAFALLFLSRSKLERCAWAGVIVLLLFAVIATNSRGGFIGLVSVGAAMWFCTPKKVLSALLIGLLCGVLALSTPESYWKEMQTIETAGEGDDTGAQRLYLWGIGWKMFLDHPVIGVGAGNFGRLTDQYEKEEWKEKGVNMWGRAAHSLYFTLLPETGVVGSSLYLWILVAGCVSRRRVVRGCRTIIKRGGTPPEALERIQTLRHMATNMDASLVAFLVTGAFISVMYYPHFWLLTAITALLEREFNKESKRLASAPAGMPSAVPTLARRPSSRSWAPAVNR